MPDVVVATHNGLEVKLNAKGQFYATPKGVSTVTDKTLDGLKKKLDNIVRASAREQAVNLPAIILQMEDKYTDNNYSDRKLTAIWTEGTFAGINAHTGEVSFTPAGKKDKIALERGATWFRAGDPILADVRKLADEAVATKNAAREARKRLNEALDKHGARILSRSYRDDEGTTTEWAARAEHELIKALTPPGGK